MDLGAYTGDTIAEFIGYAGEWRRITALEPDPVTFAKLERNTAGFAVGVIIGVLGGAA